MFIVIENIMYSLEINDKVLRKEDQHILRIYALFDSIDACESF